MSNLAPQPIKIYPRSVKGPFRNFKSLILLIAFAVFFGTPWLPWPRAVAKDQAVMFDISSQHFYIFDLVVFAQDIFWLSGILMIAAFFLFAATTVFGRVFCGYFCFQTLWSDTFGLVQRFFQGEKPQKMRRDAAGWSWDRTWRVGATHLSWLFIAFATGFTFAAYWTYAPEMAMNFFTGQAHSTVYTTVGILTATTYLFAGFVRENVCLHICPYARFQSVMFDRDTAIVAYDFNRGEGTAGRMKVQREHKSREARQAEGHGDCIDCGYCVQVCPTGIDIREGSQLGCISCGLCIDACNEIMERLHWPRGLIRYSSERELNEGKKIHWLRPKVIGYALVLIVAGLLLTKSVVETAPWEMLASQQRQPLFVQLSDGRIQNTYLLKINNKTQDDIAFAVSIEGLSNAVLDLGRLQNLHLAPEQSLSLTVRVKADLLEPSPRQLPLTFVLKDISGEQPTLRIASVFSAPAP